MLHGREHFNWQISASSSWTQVRLENPMPLSKRLRVNFTSGAAAVQAVTATTAAPVTAVHESAPAVRAASHLRAALRLRAAPHGTSRSVHAFILFLDWFGEPVAHPLQ